MLTGWKNDPGTAWLYEVSNVALQQGLQHLQNAYVNFWAKRAKYPTFKSKHKSRASATFTTSGFRYRDGRIWLAKTSEPLAIVWSRPLPDDVEPSTVTVSRDAAGRWHISILAECPVQALRPATPAVGTDAGITCLVTLSTGEKITNPGHERRNRARLALAQRRLAKKQKGSANRARAQVKVARVHARITDRRRDHLHKLSTRIIRENQTVIIEDLPVRNWSATTPGPRDLRRGVGGAADHAGVQGGLVRADRDRRRPLLSEQQNLLGVRCDHRDDAADRSGVDVRRVRHASRPGRERGEGHTCGGALRSSLRRWCQTAPHVVLGGDRQ